MVANEIHLTYPTENKNRNENFIRLKGKRDRNYQQLKRYYFLLSVFHKTLFIPFSSGMERPACPLWQICNTITGTQEKFAFKRTDVKQWQTYSRTLSPTRIWIHHVESKFFFIRIWSPPRFTPCANAEAIFYSCEKSISRKKSGYSTENFPSLELPRNTTTTPYYPISSLLSVKWSLTDSLKQKNISNFLLWKWSWSLSLSRSRSRLLARVGRLQKVSNIVIWLGKLWYLGQLVAEESWSLLQGGRNGRTDYYSSNSLHWNQITFKALDKNNSSSLGTCPQALIVIIYRLLLSTFRFSP